MRTSVCVRCGVQFECGEKGPLPKACPPCAPEYLRQYQREYHRKRREGDPAYRAKAVEYSQRYYAKNADEIRALNRARYWADPEQKREKSRKWKAANLERCRKRARERSRERLYGLNHDEFLALLASQGGACALCGTTKPKGSFAVDHDHNTGQIRAVLCTKCNTGLGAFDDDRALLAAAIAYLKHHGQEAA